MTSPPGTIHTLEGRPILWTDEAGEPRPTVGRGPLSMVPGKLHCR
jgi:hypothetical protein